MKTYSALGGKLVANEHFQREDASFGPELAEIRSSGAQAVYVPAYQEDVQRLARERSSLEGIALLGGDGWDANELLQATGDQLSGSYFTTHYSADDPRSEVTFVEAYQREYNEVPDAVAALGYDTARYAFAAIVDADSTEKEALRVALAELEGFVGVTGPIRLDAKRNAQKPVVVVQIEKGRRNRALPDRPLRAHWDEVSAFLVSAARSARYCWVAASVLASASARSRYVFAFAGSFFMK